MAKLQMKRIRLLALRKDRKPLMEKLQRLGAVEIEAEGVWYTGGTEVFGGICRTRWFPCMFSSIKNSRSKYQPQILEFLSNSQHASLILLSPSVNFL